MKQTRELTVLFLLLLIWREYERERRFSLSHSPIHVITRELDISVMPINSISFVC